VRKLSGARTGGDQDDPEPEDTPMRPRTPYNTVPWLMCVAAIAVIVIATSTALATHRGGESVHDECFPARLWDAKRGQRPCAKIVRVDEDGSARVRVKTASGRSLYVDAVTPPW
jgi:hypothetical protein